MSKADDEWNEAMKILAELHSHWNFRDSSQSVTWRNKVLERDNYKCQKCDYVASNRKDMHAHHILAWSKYPQFGYNIDNGITLCKKCHKKFHTLYGLRCDFKDLKEFLDDKEYKP